MLKIYPCVVTRNSRLYQWFIQGKFKEYAGLVFQSQSMWSKNTETPPIFNTFAQLLKLDEKAFAECRKDPAIAELIRLDMEEGDMRGLQSTPTFFVNGKRLRGGMALINAASHFDELVK